MARPGLALQYVRQVQTLLDTQDYSDAILSGRDGPESYEDGQGLLIVYDGTGMDPSVRLNGPDGEIEFYGSSEIQLVSDAMSRAARMARKFGPSIPYLEWKNSREREP